MVLGKKEWAQNEIDSKNPYYSSGKPLKPYTCLLKWAVFENTLDQSGRTSCDCDGHTVADAEEHDKENPC